jgi:hypothetical protein
MRAAKVCDEVEFCADMIERYPFGHDHEQWLAWLFDAELERARRIGRGLARAAGGA